MKRCGYVLNQTEISVHVLTLIIITAMLQNPAVASRPPPRTAGSGDSRPDSGQVSRAQKMTPTYWLLFISIQKLTGGKLLHADTNFHVNTLHALLISTHLE